MYIQDHVGDRGGMYFTETLQDWSKFDINNRTKFDAAISSGLAVMGCNRHLYTPNALKEKKKLNLKISRYENKGTLSKLIK
jgi:hypothetical protein